MLKHKYLILLYFLTLFLSLLTSCVKKFERPSWEINAKTPLIKANLRIYDLISDTLFEKRGDTLFVVFSEALSSYSIDSLVPLQFPPYNKKVKLDSIRLNNQQITNKITLGEIVNGALPDGSSTLPITLYDFRDTVELDASSFFTSLDLLSGSLNISINNGFPAHLKNISYIIYNKNAMSVVQSGVFPNVNSKTMHTENIDLSGKELSSLLLLVFEFDAQFVFPGTIKYSDSLVTKVGFQDIKLSSATAIFPTQKVIDHKELVYLEMDNGSTMEITNAMVQKGALEIHVISTIEEKSRFTYKIPNATLNGVSFEKNIQLPPAPPGGQIDQLISYSIDGYNLDLTGLGDTVNAFYNTVEGWIDSSGNQVFLTLQDSLLLNVQVKELKPSEVTGYLGQTMLVGPEYMSFDVIDEKVFKGLKLSGATMNLRIENSFDVDASLNILNLTAKNSNTNITKTLTTVSGSKIFDISEGKNSNTAVTSILLNDFNSNASDLVNVFPNQLDYQIAITTSAKLPKSYLNKAYADSKLNASFELAVPFVVSADGITLKDTFTLNPESYGDVSNISEGKLIFYCENDFPFQASLQATFLNKDNQVVLEKTANSMIEAAEVDVNTGKSLEPVISAPEIIISKEEMKALLSSKQVIISVTLSTLPANKQLPIFDFYGIDIKAITDFKMKISRFD